jgi:undecaprenyl-diphosphatase
MEQTLVYLINREWTGPELDRAMALLSSWSAWWPFLVLGILLIAWRGGFRGRSYLICCGLCIFFVDAVTVNTLKKSVGRPRPHMVLEGMREVDLVKARPRILAVFSPPVVRESDPGIRPIRGGSFPSGHAANNFAIATVTAVFFRRWGWLAFLPAILVSYSRVYVGSHWPSDVVVSWFLSGGVSLLVLAALSCCWAKLAPRFFPSLSASQPRLIP